MTYFFSPGTGAMGVQTSASPSDAVAIADDAYAALIAGLQAGRRIIVMGGMPQLADKTATAGELWAAYQHQARVALDASDRVIIRCAEHAVAVPAEWVTYRGALRAIIAAASGDPTQPQPSSRPIRPGPDRERRSPEPRSASMAVAFLPNPLMIIAGRGWVQTVQFTLGKGLAEAPDDLTGYLAEADFAQANVATPASFQLSVLAGSIAVAGALVTLSAPADVTAAWPPGDYDFALRLYAPGDVADRWLLLSDPTASRLKIIADPTA